MWTLSSPLLMISSVKSFLVPNESRFTSSTIPLVFISVWRSYLVGIVSFCSAFCASTSCASTIWASTRSRHRSRNEEMADRDLAGLCDGLCHGLCHELCHGLGDGTGTSRLIRPFIQSLVRRTGESYTLGPAPPIAWMNAARHSLVR